MTDQTSGTEPALVDPTPETVPTPTRYNTKAVIGLILAIVSVFFVLVPILNWIIAVPGIVLGVLGRNEIAGSGERSRELATAAVVVAALSAGFSLVLLIAIGSAAAGVAHQVGPGGVGDVCTSTTGDFTQQQLQDCFDSQDD